MTNMCRFGGVTPMPLVEVTKSNIHYYIKMSMCFQHTHLPDVSSIPYTDTNTKLHQAIVLCDDF